MNSRPIRRAWVLTVVCALALTTLVAAAAPWKWSGAFGDKTMTLLVIGDIQIHSRRPDPVSAFQHLRDTLQRADLVYANLEGVLVPSQGADGEVFEVTPPSYRFDIEIEEDLIEEVARIYGFERIAARPPVAESEMRPTNEGRRSTHVVRHALAARDYQEVINFAFVEEKWERDFAAPAVAAIPEPKSWSKPAR